MVYKRDKNITKYVSGYPDLHGWMMDFAHHLHADPEKDIVWFPENFANGYSKVIEVAEGLTCRLVDYKLNTDFNFVRNPSDHFYLVIYLYHYRNCRNLEFEINGRSVIKNKGADYSSLLMTNSFSCQELKVAQDSEVQGLTIQLTEDWLKKIIKPASRVNLGLLKQKDVFQTLIKPAYRVLINEIFNPDKNSYTPDLYLSSRILRLLELFFDEILRYGLKANVLPASIQDVQSILAVEQFLLENYQQPFPTINYLSRMAMMSSSKLKQTFKMAFGISLFEYFQRNRMNRAKELLISGNCSVTEVGKLLGYQNLSNFTAAFKKEFGVLPKNANLIT